MDPVTLWIFCFVLARFLMKAWEAGTDAAREEARLAREEIGRAVAAKREEIRRKIEDAGKSSPAQTPWWFAWAAWKTAGAVRRGWRNYRQRGTGPAAIGGKHPGPLRRVAGAAWRGGKAGARDRWQQHTQRPRPARPPKAPRTRSGPRRRAAGTPGGTGPVPGMSWRLDREDPQPRHAPASPPQLEPAPGPAARPLPTHPELPPGWEPYPSQEPAGGPAGVPSGTPASPVPAAGPGVPAAVPVSVPAPALVPAGALPTGGQPMAGQQYTPNTTRAAGGVPAVAGAGGSGESRTHGLWLTAAAELDRWLCAQGRVLTLMLEGLHSADGNRQQVNGVVDYTRAVAGFVKDVRDGVAKVDPKEKHIIAAIPGGNPDNINAMSYYTGAVGGARGPVTRRALPGTTLPASSRPSPALPALPATGAGAAYHHGVWEREMELSIGIDVGLAQMFDRMSAGLTEVGAGKLKTDTTLGWHVTCMSLIEQGARLLGKTNADVEPLLIAVMDVGVENVARDKHQYQL